MTDLGGARRAAIDSPAEHQPVPTPVPTVNITKPLGLGARALGRLHQRLAELAIAQTGDGDLGTVEIHAHQLARGSPPRVVGLEPGVGLGPSGRSRRVLADRR
jgi:hypothetical protein